jgi:hypothetical protein
VKTREWLSPTLLARADETGILVSVS